MTVFDRLSIVFAAIAIDATLKSIVLLALVAAAALCARRASASFRHLLWALGLGFTFLLPVFSLVLPQWRVTVNSPIDYPGQETPQSAGVTESAPGDAGEVTIAAPSTMVRPGAVGAAHSLPERSDGNDSARVAVVSGTTNYGEASASAQIPPTVWLGGAFVVWIAGGVFAAARLVRGLRGLRLVAKASARVTAGPLTAEMENAARSLFVRRAVILLLSERLAVPITWGVKSPVIVLPAGAEAWTTDKLRSALLHEMAHVRRSDWLLQRLAYGVCALQWFNPLVWFAARRLQAEGETACDDLVLTAGGVSAADYARHLLDVALQARDIRRIATGAVAMAQTNRVEGRLRTILAKGLRRGSVGRRVSLAALAAMALLAVPLAALKVVPPAEAQAHSPAVLLPAVVATTAAVSRGGIFRLIGISDSLSGKGRWWGREGGHLPGPLAPALDALFAHLYNDGKTYQARLLLFQVEGRQTEEDLRVGIPTAGGSILRIVGVLPDGHRRADQTVFGIATNLPVEQRTTDIRVGVAAHTWKTVAEHAITANETEGTSNSSDAGLVSGTVSFALNGVNDAKRPSFRVTFKTALIDPGMRVVAVDTHGNTTIGENAGMMSGGGKFQTTVFFPPQTLKDIKKLQLQIRPFEWQEFPAVPLQPSSNVAPRSEVETGLYAALRNTAEVHIALGKSREEKGQPGDGVPEYRRAIRLDPNNAEAQYELAQGLWSSSDKRTGNRVDGNQPPRPVLKEAIWHLQRAVALDPSRADWESTLGLELANDERYREAVPHFQRALALLGHADVLGDDNKAQSIFDTQWTFGDALLKLHQYREALAQYQEAIKFGPKDDWVLLGYGNALDGVGRHAEARAVWKKVVAADGTDFYYGRLANERLSRR